MSSFVLHFLLLLSFFNHVELYSRRIIDGIDADIEDFPMMAAITDGEMVLCSAIILSDSWIATAGHCYEP
jgi:secreted trypsin-like serine protease